jgi:hypothetical protein
MAVSTPSIQSARLTSEAGPSLYDKLNTKWHERALQVFMAIVLAHWGEHLFQAYQIYVMGWPRPKANGQMVDGSAGDPVLASHRASPADWPSDRAP